MKLNYANYRDGQNRINRRPYWIYAIYRDYQNENRIYANYRDGQNRN